MINGQSAHEPQSASHRPGGALGRIARNSTLGLVGTGLSAVLAVVSVMVLARALGKDLLGLYYTVFVMIVVVQLLVEAGISTVLTIRVSTRLDEWREIVAEAAGLLLLVAAASMAVLIVVGLGWAAWRGDPRLLGLCVLGGIACVAMQVQFFCGGLMRAFERFEFDSLAKVLQWTVFTVLIVLYVESGFAGVQTAVLMFTVSHVLAAVYMIAVVQRRWPCRSMHLNWSIARGWLTESVPLGLADIFRRLTLQVDQVLLILMQPPAVLGIYSVAYRPIGPLSQIPRSIVMASFPYFSRAAADRSQTLSLAFTASIRLLWLISLPIAITVCALAERVVVILGGPEFREAAAPMRVLMAMLVLSYPSTQFRFALAAIGRQRIFTTLVIAGFIFQLVLEAALIPRFGYMGACSGFFVGELLFMLVGFALCRRKGIGRAPWASLLRAVPGAAVMGAGLWLSRDAHLLLVAGAIVGLGGLYAALCVLLGAIPKDDLQLVVSTLRIGLAKRRRNAEGGASASGPASVPSEVSAPEPTARHG